MIPPEITRAAEALRAEFGEARKTAERLQARWPSGDRIRVRLRGEAIAYAAAEERIGELLELMREHDAE